MTPPEQPPGTFFQDPQGQRIPVYDTPQTIDAAWTQYILEFDLPKDLKSLLLSYVKNLVNLAAKSNIKRREIPMHLLEYDQIWQRYRIFMHSGKFEQKLYVVKEIIRHALELQLNRSVDGWQGNLMFKRYYEIKQTQPQDKIKRFTNFFKSKKEEGEK